MIRRLAPAAILTLVLGPTPAASGDGAMVIVGGALVACATSINIIFTLISRGFLVVSQESTPTHSAPMGTAPIVRERPQPSQRKERIFVDGEHGAWILRRRGSKCLVHYDDETWPDEWIEEDRAYR